MQVKLGRVLWLSYGPDLNAFVLHRFRRTFLMVVAPRPEATPIGGWIAGWHFRLTFDWVDCDLELRKVSYQ